MMIILLKFKSIKRDFLSCNECSNKECSYKIRFSTFENIFNSTLFYLFIYFFAWVVKKLFAARLAMSLECVCCDEMKEPIGHTFFHCSIIRLLCQLLDGYLVRILNENSLFSKPVLSLNSTEHNVFLYLLGLYESRDLGDKTEGIPRRRVFLAGDVLQISNQDYVCEKKTILLGVWQKVVECCAFVSRKRY